jgi:uncharacterized protein (DUF697 family)/tellurite resistance protein
MNPEQQQATLAIALFAAFSDSVKDEREREHIRQLAISLGNEAHSPDLPKLYQDVLLKRVSLASATAALTDPNHRQLAYEMAVCVCDADGRQSDAERRFLEELRGLLELDAGQAMSLGKEADTLAELTEEAAPATAPATPRGVATGPVVAAVPNIPESELDRSILNSSILNGALELLPQSWASVAIIPLQIKLVYRIGKAYGVELDQGHIKEFLATAGVGLTSQYLEQFGRKLLGGLLGKAAGGFAGKLGRTATGMAFSFATTYALGQLSKRYYAGGRQMSGAVLRETFENLLGPAKEVQARYLPNIQQTASQLDAAKVMALVRGT